MELVFIHGWGFDASFWDALAPLLSEYPQRRIDRGYFGQPSEDLKTDTPAILIGHSLGFVHGMQQKQNWRGWVAINGFARFVKTSDGNGCVPALALRDMRMKLAANPALTLRDFYNLIDAKHVPLIDPDMPRLRDGLDELRDAHIHMPDVPGLILASANDPLVPRTVSEALAAKAPDPQLNWHVAGGHLLPQTDPVWCAGLIKNFVATL